MNYQKRFVGLKVLFDRRQRLFIRTWLMWYSLEDLHRLLGERIEIRNFAVWAVDEKIAINCGEKMTI
jgi:hypothetical protein